MGYASRTGTLATQVKLRALGWRLMLSAKGSLHTGGMRYALDNGAWSAYATGTAFDENAFWRAFDQRAVDADFVVVPDIVAGGKQSLDFSLRWLERLRGAPCPLLLAVQDGIELNDIRGLVGRELGIFVGGSTDWKLTSMAEWGDLARQVDAYLHVGRVNTRKRIALCISVGADSFDGSAISRWPIHMPLLDDARFQSDFFAEGHLP